MRKDYAQIFARGLASIITLSVEEKAIMARREDMREMWDRALANMPYKELFIDNGQGYKNSYCSTMGSRYGQQTALAKCLGYNSHTAVYDGWSKGSVPKGKRFQALQKLAGPYGKLFALLKLRRKDTMLGWQRDPKIVKRVKKSAKLRRKWWKENKL